MKQADTGPVDDILDPRGRARLARTMALTRVALVWERMVPLLWPGFGALLLTFSLSLLEFWSIFPGWLHTLLLATASVLTLGLFARGLMRWRPVTEADVVTALDRQGGVLRPLGTIRDRLAAGAGDPAADALWQAHRRRMAAAVNALQAPAPDARMARRDPWAVRLAVIFVFVLAVAIGGRDAGPRLQAALSPGFGPSVPADETTVEAWVTPPAYTGRAPVFLTAFATTGAEPVEVPTGSRIVARYHGDGTPSLAIGTDETIFEPMGKGDHQIESAITAGDRIAISVDGQDLRSWPMVVLPDAVPLVSMVGKPEATLRGALSAQYTATDDYGVAGVSLRIVRPGRPDEILIELPAPSRAGDDATETMFRDLSAHPWAGQPVELVFEARDDAGQIGTSAPHAMTLPERRFNNPVARAVIEMRRKLLDQPEMTRDWVIRAIAAVQINPGRYRDDLVVHLTLSLARSQLIQDAGPASVAEVQDTLWKTALRLEDGNLSTAAERLREIQQRLMQALAEGAPDEEIQRLMDELQQAMDEYLVAMQEDAMKRMEDGEELDEFEQTETLDRQALQDMLDSAREMSQSGARDRARDMLSQLQDLLENLQMGQSSGRPQGEQEAERMVDELGRMMEQQQRLMDRTFERNQRARRPNSRLPSENNPFMAPNGNRPGRNADRQGGGEQQQPGDGELSGQQGDLRRQLGDLMRRLNDAMGGFPDEFGDAESAMRDAQRA
ncbi:MAG: TIGR02302 family protein, partial [Pseudomonadota bacterium]|nr:TIGR02302 family protein [Pseudomonadota bacterium]